MGRYSDVACISPSANLARFVSFHIGASSHTEQTTSFLLHVAHCWWSHLRAYLSKLGRWVKRTAGPPKCVPKGMLLGGPATSYIISAWLEILRLHDEGIDHQLLAKMRCLLEVFGPQKQTSNNNVGACVRDRGVCNVWPAMLWASWKIQVPSCTHNAIFACQLLSCDFAARFRRA